MAEPLDRHDLYELCVQSPRQTAALLRAIHGGGPVVLGEDFAGTGALSRQWVRSTPGGRAVAIDLDEAALSRCAGAPGVRAIVGDIRSATTDASVDVLFVGNFSIGEIHERSDLIAYLRRCRGRLSPGGVFVCDTYGGETALVTGSIEREHTGPGGERVEYTWQQRSADPLTGRVTNAMHFEVFDGGRLVQEVPEAFVYDWRLWSVPELRDAMTEAGLTRTAVFDPTPDAVDDEGAAYVQPIEDPAALDDSFNVYIAAWAG